MSASSSMTITVGVVIAATLLVTCGGGSSSVSGGSSGNGPASHIPGTWSAAASMQNSRYDHVAVLLQDGRVLAGFGINPNATPTSVKGDIVHPEIYNPTSNTWSAAGHPSGLVGITPTATLLNSGGVLFTGGCISGSSTQATFIYDPSTNQWSAAADMATLRGWHAAVALPDGKVLVAGGEPICDGQSDPSASAQIYDPATNTWTAAASMHTARFLFTMTSLLDGRVLVTGGGAPDASGGPPRQTASAEIYDPVAGTWTPTASMNGARMEHTATRLQDGRVLIVAGSYVTETPSSSEVYDPATGAWTVTGHLAIARAGHTATLLHSGKVIVTGGSPLTTNPPLNETELFDAMSGTWSVGASMAEGRAGHTATLLQNATLLVAGGLGAAADTGFTCELY